MVTRSLSRKRDANLTFPAFHDKSCTTVIIHGNKNGLSCIPNLTFKNSCNKKYLPMRLHRPSIGVVGSWCSSVGQTLAMVAFLDAVIHYYMTQFA